MGVKVKLSGMTRYIDQDGKVHEGANLAQREPGYTGDVVEMDPEEAKRLVDGNSAVYVDKQGRIEG
jgi:hypothetical protein